MNRSGFNDVGFNGAPQQAQQGGVIEFGPQTIVVQFDVSGQAIAIVGLSGATGITQDIAGNITQLIIIPPALDQYENRILLTRPHVNRSMQRFNGSKTKNILGKFIKQPIEVEKYLIDFGTDIDESDFIVSSWCMISDYFVLESAQIIDNYENPLKINSLHYANQNVFFPSASDSEKISISNYRKNQNIQIINFETNEIILEVEPDKTICFFSENGSWIPEAIASSTLIQNTNKVVTTVSGGVDFNDYKCEITAITSSGRVLQNEFLIMVKEI